ncbi:MAG TPA: hypothetical protein VMV60_14695 [Thermoanaerobaculia bacterium]|nr:hypothetical protein [Thermoanaerobaculia bacterium]
MNAMATTGFVYLQYANQSARLYGVDVSGRALLAKGGAGRLDANLVAAFVQGENRTSGGDLYNVMPANAKVALVHRLGGWTNTAEVQAVSARAPRARSTSP